MADRIVIRRHEEYITLNPFEYLLDDKGELMEFKSIEHAKDFLRTKGCDEFDGLCFVPYADMDKPLA